MLPEGWEMKTLGDVAIFLDEKRKPIKSADRKKMQGKYPYYGATGIIDWVDKYIFDDNLILMGEDGENILSRNLPHVFSVNGKFWVNNHAHILKPKKNINLTYLTIYLESLRYEKYNSGSAQPKLNKAVCQKINVLIPPLPEQQKIAQILSTWDKAITTVEQLLSNSQQRKKALMQQLLTGKKRLLDDNGERFSEVWLSVHIKDCADCLDNKRVPLNSEQRLKMQGSIPYWGANGVVDHISDFIFDETIVLLAEDGGYFDEYHSRNIASISFGKCWVNNHAHILRAKGNFLNEWLYFSLVNKNILAFVNSGTRRKLNKKDMLMIPISLPSLEEQQKIAAVLSTADREIEALQHKLDCLKQEKKALMQQLLTGKRKVHIE